MVERRERGFKRCTCNIRAAIIRALLTNFHCQDALVVHLSPEDFYFSSMQTTEDMTRYISGGYHVLVTSLAQ